VEPEPIERRTAAVGDENDAVTLTAIGRWGAYPSAGEATSSFLLETRGAAALLDCGSGVLAALQHRLALEALDAVFLSHYHWDHAGDIGCLQYAVRILTDLGRRRGTLPIYGLPAGEGFARLGYHGYTAGRPIDPAGGIEFRGLRLRFAANAHPDPAVSMRIEAGGAALAYITDTAWTEGLTELARGAALLVCESSLYDEFRGRVPGHLSAGEAGRIAAAAGVGRLVLTHLPHWGEHERLREQARQVFDGPVELAQPGSRWSIG
jgi:ribonuclease BN (tRNA processing enzyme)